MLIIDLSSKKLMFKRKLPAVWPREAVTALLEIIEERKILQLIDGRSQRNSEIFTVNVYSKTWLMRASVIFPGIITLIQFFCMFWYLSNLCLSVS